MNDMEKQTQARLSATQGARASLELAFALKDVRLRAPDDWLLDKVRWSLH
jgi:hypothetical protein